MRRERLALAAFVALASAGSLSNVSAAAGAVGSPATAVEPTEWLNAPAGISWAALKGRLVIVEKWATW